MDTRRYDKIVKHISDLSGRDYEAMIERTMNEPVRIMPVMHAVSSSAFQVLRDLMREKPQAIFIEGPPEYNNYTRLLDGCRLPVSFLATPRRNVEGAENRQGITFPMVLASAETQAILFAQLHDIPIFFVDTFVEERALLEAAKREKIKNDIKRQKEEEARKKKADEMDPLSAKEDDDILRLHSKMGVILRDTPSDINSSFRGQLLKTANTSSVSEYLEYYLDNEVRHLEFDSWKRTMMMEGVLGRFAFDSLNPEVNQHFEDYEIEFHQEVSRRDRVMWTNIKQHIKEHGFDPASTVFICGAAHAVTLAPEFGTADLDTFEPDPTLPLTPVDYDGDQCYHIGILPNSHRAVDKQFGHVPGFVRRITDKFRMTCREYGIEPLLPRELPDDKSATRPLPSLDHVADRDNPAAWAQSVVNLARERNLLTSTADAIAIAEATDLLATLRNRSIPSSSDFLDGAVMCLAKDESQVKEVLSVCYEILGISESGAIPNSSLPALLKDFFKRLNHIPGVIRDDNGLPHEIQYKIDLKNKNQTDYDLHYETSMLLWRMLTLIAKLPFTEGRFPLLPVLGGLELGVDRGIEDWRLLFTPSNIRKMIAVSLIAPTVEDAIELNFLDLFRQNPPLSAALAIYIESITLQVGLAAQEELENQLVGFAKQLTLKDSYLSLTYINALIGHYQAQNMSTPPWFHQMLVEAFEKICSEISVGFSGNEEPLSLSQGLSFLDNIESQLLRWGVDATTQIEITLGHLTNASMKPTARTLYLVAQKKWFLIPEADFEKELRIAFSTMDNLDVCLGLMLSLFFYAKLAPKVAQLLHHNLSTLSDKAVFKWLANLIVILKECPPHLVQTLLRSQQMALSAHQSDAGEVSITDFDAFIAAMAGPLELPEIELEVTA